MVLRVLAGVRPFEADAAGNLGVSVPRYCSCVNLSRFNPKGCRSERGGGRFELSPFTSNADRRGQFAQPPFSHRFAELSAPDAPEIDEHRLISGPARSSQVPGTLPWSGLDDDRWNVFVIRFCSNRPRVETENGRQTCPAAREHRRSRGDCGSELASIPHDAA